MLNFIRSTPFDLYNELVFWAIDGQAMPMKLFDDTQPVAERVYVQMISKASARKKIEMLDQLYITGIDITLASIRRRHPCASPQEIKRHLADLLYGKSIADRIFPSFSQPKT